MTVPLHTGVRTSTVHAEWSVWDTRCRLVVTDPWALRRAGDVVEEQLAAVDRIAGPRRAGSVVRRLRRDGRRVAPGELLAARTGPVAQLGPYPYGLTVASGDGPVHHPACAPWQQATDPVRASDRDELRLERGPSVRAWTAQQCAQLVAETTSCGALVSVGSDVATSGLAPVGGWRVVLPDGPGAPVAVVAVDGGALSYLCAARAGRRDDRGALRRIVVPATGRVVAPTWRSVTVAASTGPAASVACTGAMLRGRAAPVWLAGLQLPARLVALDGSVHIVGRWPRPV